jgi:hypothetical protein
LVPLGVFAQAGAALPGATPARAFDPGAAGQVPPYEAAPRSNGPLIAILIFLGLAVILLTVLIVAKL